MEKLNEALRSLKTQLDQMSESCEEWINGIDDIDGEKILELEKDFLRCKKKVFNAANGVNGEIIKLSKNCTVNV